MSRRTAAELRSGDTIRRAGRTYHLAAVDVAVDAVWADVPAAGGLALPLRLDHDEPVAILTLADLTIPGVPP